MFPSSTLQVLTSAHTLILATLSTGIPKSHCFRFENAWLYNSDFLLSVLPAWHQAPTRSDAASTVTGRLKSLRAAAKVWSRRNRATPAIVQNCKFIDLEEDRPLSLDDFQVRLTDYDRLALDLKPRAAYWKQSNKPNSGLCEKGTTTQPSSMAMLLQGCGETT
jgi:hypothetical protein